MKLRSMQEAAPELPGTVEGLPPDLLAWSLVLVGAGWWLRLGVQAWRRAQHRRREAVAFAKAEKKGQSDASSILQELQSLLAGFREQDEEAGALLALFVRTLCTERWGVDCAAFADAELLRAVDRHLGKGAPHTRLRYLEPLLRLATEAQFAGRRFTVSHWQEVLKTAKAWQQKSGNPEVGA